MKNVPSGLNNLKSKVDTLNDDKLVPIPVDISKLSYVVTNGVVKKDLYNAKIKTIEDNIPDITYIATNASLNAKTNEVEGEIPSSTNLATTASLTTIENKIPNISDLVKKLTITQKLMKL